MWCRSLSMYCLLTNSSCISSHDKATSDLVLLLSQVHGVWQCVEGSWWWCGGRGCRSLGAAETEGDEERCTEERGEMEGSRTGVRQGDVGPSLARRGGGWSSKASSRFSTETVDGRVPPTASNEAWYHWGNSENSSSVSAPCLYPPTCSLPGSRDDRALAHICVCVRACVHARLCVRQSAGDSFYTTLGTGGRKEQYPIALLLQQEF